MADQEIHLLSQNFIKSRKLVSELLAATNVTDQDLVLEIGPGKGIITEQLVEVAKEVIAVEKDKKLYQELNLKFKISNLKIHNEDFLDYELPRKPYKVVSNIPFSITARIVNKFLTAVPMPESMYLIMQLEAAEKFTGRNGETMSSMLARPWYEIEILGEIDRTNFTLKPQVTIVFVKFLKRKNPYVREELKRHYRDFITYGFSKWAPTISEAFSDAMSFAQRKQFEKIYKIGKLKPSELSFDNWLLMFKAFDKIVNEDQLREIKNFVKTIK